MSVESWLSFAELLVTMLFEKKKKKLFSLGLMRSRDIVPPPTYHDSPRLGTSTKPVLRVQPKLDHARKVRKRGKEGEGAEENKRDRIP